MPTTNIDTQTSSLTSSSVVAPAATPATIQAAPTPAPVKVNTEAVEAEKRRRRLLGYI